VRHAGMGGRDLGSSLAERWWQKRFDTSGMVLANSRPGGISPLTDQQLAGGMMWGPGSIPFAIVVFWALYRWLGDDEPRRRRRSAAPLRPEITSR